MAGDEQGAELPAAAPWCPPGLNATPLTPNHPLVPSGGQAAPQLPGAASGTACGAGGRMLGKLLRRASRGSP